VSAGTSPGRHGPFGAAKSKAERKASLAKHAKYAKEILKAGGKPKKAMHFSALFAPWRENILPFYGI
jgi:hypothetical protein